MTHTVAIRTHMNESYPFGYSRLLLVIWLRLLWFFWDIQVQFYLDSLSAQMRKLKILIGDCILCTVVWSRGSASMRQNTMHWPWTANEPFFSMLRKICNFVSQSLPGGNAQGTYEEANKDENKEKNRYPNILPCECTFCSKGAWFSVESNLAHCFL